MEGVCAKLLPSLAQAGRERRRRPGEKPPSGRLRGGSLHVRRTKLRRFSGCSLRISARPLIGAMRCSVVRSSCSGSRGNELIRVLSRPSGSPDQVAARSRASGRVSSAARCWHRPRCGRARMKFRVSRTPQRPAVRGSCRSDGCGWVHRPSLRRPGRIAESCQGRAALGGDPGDRVLADQQTGDGWFVRPSNRTLQPTSEAVTGVVRSVA